MDITEAIENFCDFDYPVKCQEVKEDCDVLFETPNGEEFSLEEVVNCGGSPEVFQSKDELFNHIMSRAPKSSVGREKYDDRGNNYSTGEEMYSF